MPSFPQLLGAISQTWRDRRDDVLRSGERVLCVLNRTGRARLLAYAEGRPRLMEKMACEQARLTRCYTRLFATAQDNGWFNRDFDPQAAAVFIQAYTIGKIVDDVTTEPMDPAAWNVLIMKIVDRVFI